MGGFSGLSNFKMPGPDVAGPTLKPFMEAGKGIGGTSKFLGKSISGGAKGAGGSISSGFKNATSGFGDYLTDAATKVGLGQYKPGSLPLDDTAFTDTTRSDARTKALGDQLANVQGRAAPTMNAATIGPVQNVNAAQLSNEQNQFRNGQVDLANALTAQANGQGPSLATAQLNQARDQNIQTAMGLAASQRGLTAGQGLRSIADQTAGANRFASAEAARQRIGEQLAAREQLAGVQAAGRGADIDFASQNAGLSQQANLANQAAGNEFTMNQALLNQQANANNQGAALQQTGMNDSFSNSLNAQLNGLSSEEQQRLMDLQKLKFGGALTQQGIEANSFNERNKNIGNFLGGLGGAFSGLGSMASGISGMGAAAAPAAAVAV